LSQFDLVMFHRAERTMQLRLVGPDE